MRRPGVATLMLLAGGALLAASGCTQRVNRKQVLGQQIYSDNCALCHDYHPVGLKKTPPSLIGLYSHPRLPDGVTPTTDAAVRRVVIEGKGTMPAFDGRLSAAEVDDLIAYLHAK